MTVKSCANTWALAVFVSGRELEHTAFSASPKHKQLWLNLSTFFMRFQDMILCVINSPGS